MNQRSGQPNPDLRTLRHDIRGRMNAIVLCTSALNESVPRDEALFFLESIAAAADKIVMLLDQLESVSA